VTRGMLLVHGAGGAGFAPGRSCQWPCSADQVLPGGAAPGGWGADWYCCGRPSVASCQWPCSADQTFPAGAGPAGCPVYVPVFFTGGAVGAGDLLALAATISSNPTTHALAIPPRTRVILGFLFASAPSAPQQCLYFLPLPHSHGVLGPSLVGMVCLLTRKGSRSVRRSLGYLPRRAPIKTLLADELGVFFSFAHTRKARSWPRGRASSALRRVRHLGRGGLPGRFSCLIRCASVLTRNWRSF
jgi:hypothetical protein